MQKTLTLLPPHQVGHDHESTENVTWCQGEGCFTLNLTYSVPLPQIEALIAMSENCEQEIKFEVRPRKD